MAESLSLPKELRFRSAEHQHGFIMNMKYAIRRIALLAVIAPLAAVAAFDPLPESFTRAKWI